jgi:exopolysaccharide biosynthesis polyprenyl glycosylphosphotransferase
LAACLVLVSIAVGSYRGESFLYLWRIGFKALLASLLALMGGTLVVLLADGSAALADEFSRQAISRGSIACLALLLVARLVFAYAYRLGAFTRRLVVLGSPEAGERVAQALDAYSGGTFDLVARFDIAAENSGTDVVAQCRQRGIWGVVLANTSSDREQAMAQLLATQGGVRLITQAELWEKYLHRINLDSLTEEPSPRGNGHWLEVILHRLIDILLSLGLLAFSLPLMIATAVAIRLESPGSVFYRQERVGQHGIAFTLYKFRSMRPDAEASGPVWAQARDNRVTRIGQFIRLSRIDELPQLLNILRGEMSFIGPRPERPVFVAQLEAEIPFYAGRAQVKPGLTGWAQVNYPYGASVEDARMKLSYDLYYVKNQSIYLDVSILFSTIRVILFQEGAR